MKTIISEKFLKFFVLDCLIVFLFGCVFCTDEKEVLSPYKLEFVPTILIGKDPNGSSHHNFGGISDIHVDSQMRIYREFITI